MTLTTTIFQLQPRHRRIDQLLLAKITRQDECGNGGVHTQEVNFLEDTQPVGHVSPLLL